MSQSDATHQKPKFYLTTPIYYANSRPHVGSAYTTIVCDVIARYKRMCGYDVAFVTGTDEHGVNIERAAEAKGITPQQLVDQNEKIFRELWKLLGITNRIGDGGEGFVRTTSPEHERAVQTLVRRTMKRSPNAIFKRKYEGRYCIYDNAYVSDTPEPINCPTCGRPAELISEENYFFRLSAYKDRLLDLYKANPKFVQPDFRMNEVRSFVEGDLRDISISRKSIKWGIPWPGDPEHVFYVWYDALTSYMTAIGYASDDRAKQEQFERFWPADLHMIGKEIIRFHAVYWPAFLMAAELPLPKQIFAHGWLLFEQEKMSKSKGNVAYPEPIVKAFDEVTGAKVGNDALRYYLLRETVFGQDGNFSREALITRYNADLANGLGNLASRVLTMIANYCGGVIPEGSIASGAVARQRLAARFDPGNFSSIRLEYFHYNFSRALELSWELVATINEYLVLEKPWELAAIAGERRRLESVLYDAAEAIRIITALAHPVIPEATQKIWERLGQPGKLADFGIDQLKWGDLKPGTKIGKPEAVFPRVDKKELSERIEAMENEIRNPSGGAPAASHESPAATTPATAGATPATTPKIAIEDFAKVELRVGQIKSAERIQGADKLLKLLVDVGDETRQILAGIALAYSPEELIGRKVVIVANLAPRKMRGLESNGMLLAASVGPDGKPVLCTFAEDIAPGAKVK
ncbi:MAG TPA: methionine--tRNA ligase [Candidatus Acidoferrales bacterium]|jgi:methionyl-tRNA synthetase|nr:methionine--tRNA ligase [Candidatus Acidoferrales bacterium]